MFKIDNDTRLLKHNVLQRVSELAYQGKLCDDTIQEIPFEQIPGRQTALIPLLCVQGSARDHSSARAPGHGQNASTACRSAPQRCA